MEYAKIAKRVILEESEALLKFASNIPYDFSNIVQYILTFKGRVVLTGVGKSGHIARKIASSLASTGTPAIYVHPAEASHGDLGMITKDDLVIMLSNSGQSAELSAIINYCKHLSIKTAAITMNESSALAKSSDFLLLMPKHTEASNIGAPTTSSVMMLAMGDAIMVALQEAKSFSKVDYHLYHPGGKIGANLLE